MEENISQILDKATEYVLKNGEIIPIEPYNFNTGESGSDAASVNINSTLRSFKRNGFEIKLKDERISSSYGTSSFSWQDNNYRKIEIYVEGSLAVQAKRCIGGESGHSGIFSSSKKIIEPTNWEVNKKDSLEKILQYLN